jgi:DNA repair/transcription protein MET18/MMS19
MDTISACLPTYTAAPFIPHLAELWNLLRNEMAQGADEANELSALKCIRELVKALSKSIVISTDTVLPLEKFLNLIITDCLKNLTEPELKYAKPCGKILMACASSCMSACTMVIDTCLTVLLEKYESLEAPSKKKIILEAIVDLILSCRLIVSLNRSGMFCKFTSRTFSYFTI